MAASGAIVGGAGTAGEASTPCGALTPGAPSGAYAPPAIDYAPASAPVQPAMDPYGRIYVRWKVEAVDQDGMPVGLVAVDAQIWSPQGGPWARTRWTHWDGFARFPWGSNYSGAWTIDVTNMTLAGYTFLDGANCTATGNW